MLNQETLRAAGTRVRQAGGRVTDARVQVLGVLLEAGQALSHHEIELRMQRGAAVDRVTLYRVLDWMVEKGLAHRISSTDRVWRYSIAGAGHHDHAHFHCDHCGRLLCLDRLKKQSVRLPRGYRSKRVELTVKGLCADCS
jgi:Fur family ferric uptake transcriptional regulator